MSINFLALGAVLLWSSYAAIVVNLTQLPPLLLMGLGLSVGGLTGVLGYKKWIWNFEFFVTTAISTYFYNLLLFLAFQKGHPVVVNFINYLWPALLVLISVWAHPLQKIKKLQVIGLIVSFIGCAVALFGYTGQTKEGNSILAYSLAFMAAVLWASYSYRIEKFKNISSWNIGPPVFVAGLCSIVLSKLTGESWALDALRLQKSFPWILFLGLGSMGFAFTLWQAGIQKHGARSVGSLSYLTPVLSSIWLVLMLGEPFQFALALSLGLVLLGTWLSSVDLRKPT